MRRARAPDRGRGGGRAGRGRPGGRREPLLAAAQPARRRPSWRRPARADPRVLHHHDLPVAAPAPGPPAATTGRPGLGARDDQRAEPRASWPPAASARRRCTTRSIPTRLRATGHGRRAALGVRDRGARSCSNRPGPWRARTSPGAIALAEAVGGTYWLLGPAEDGYGPELERLVGAGALPGPPRRARGRLHHRRRLRRLRRRPAAVDVGGLRQPLGRVGDLPAPARHRAPTRWRPSWRRSASAGSTPPTRPRWRRGCARPTSGLLAQNHRVAADALQPGRPPAAAVPRSCAQVPGLPVTPYDRSVT